MFRLEWLKAPLYKLTDSTSLSTTHGHLTDRKLRQAWSRDIWKDAGRRIEEGLTDAEQEMVRSIMERFGMLVRCSEEVKIGGGRKPGGWVVVDQVPAGRLRNLDGDGCTVIRRANLAFVPDNTLIDFASRNLRRVKPTLAEHLYRNRVTLIEDGCDAIVQINPDTGEIEIGVRDTASAGRAKRVADALLEEITRELPAKVLETTNAVEPAIVMGRSHNPSLESAKTSSPVIDRFREESSRKALQLDRLRAAIRRLLERYPDGLSAAEILADHSISPLHEHEGSNAASALNKHLGKDWPEFKVVGGGRRSRWVLKTS